MRPASDAERLGIVAFGLAVTSFVLSIWLILSTDTDPGQVRWWLVVAPLILTGAPLVLPRRQVWIAATVLLCLWCAVTGFSIGMLFLPALVAMFFALRRSGR
jgi:hypothetical protein